MPISDQLVTELVAEDPVATDEFWYVKDPGGSPAPRRTNLAAIQSGIFTGTNFRPYGGFLQIKIDGTEEWVNIRCRYNDDDVPELYLEPAQAIGGEGGADILTGEGEEGVAEE